MSRRITDTFPQKKQRAQSEVKRSFGKSAAKDDKAPRQVVEDKVEAGPSDDLEEKHIQLLKDFDLNWEYGPCMGITRLERWNRANKHGLNPPQTVKDLLELHPNDSTYAECLWQSYNIL